MPSTFLTFLNFQPQLLFYISLWRLFCQSLDHSLVCWPGSGKYLAVKVGLGELWIFLFHHLPKLPAPKSYFCQGPRNSVTTKWLIPYYRASQHLWLNSHPNNISSHCPWGLLLIYPNDECSLFWAPSLLQLATFMGYPHTPQRNDRDSPTPGLAPISKDYLHFFPLSFPLKKSY